MPRLDWIGKNAVKGHHQEVPIRRLAWDERRSVGSGQSCGNLLIEGDNLLALRALSGQYAGRVKCIYIDPPYNTGSQRWVYNDNVNAPEIRRWLGEVVGGDGPGQDRHDRWLCMMYPRLRLLAEMLSPEGVMFISIDDTEVHGLRYLAEEVPGIEFAGSIVWERKRKGSHLSRRLTQKTEYILVYARDADRLQLYGKAAGEDEDFPLLKRTNPTRTLRLPHAAIEPTRLADGIYPSGEYGRGSTGVRLLAPTRISGGRFVEDVILQGPFVWTQENLDRELAEGGRLFIRTRSFNVRALKALHQQGFKALSSLLTREVGTNEDATDELAEILGADVGQAFQFSKPSSLIETLVRAATHADTEAIVLDAFAGSGTTGHAVLRLNARDGGRRRFVLIEMEPDVAQRVAAERLKRVIHGYGGMAGLGGGYRYARLGEVIEDVTRV